VAFVAFVAFGATSARAEDALAPFTIGSKPGWFATAGVTAGGTAVAHARGGFVGGELSLVRLREGRFIGAYADAYYDVGARSTYATTGVELGYKFFGVDGGLASRFGPGNDAGPTARLFFTVGILSVYARYAYLVDPSRGGGENVLQVGGLFKLPFAAWGG
jgi:hypothetical protein